MVGSPVDAIAIFARAEKVVCAEPLVETSWTGPEAVEELCR
jgi:hypothetical protein